MKIKLLCAAACAAAFSMNVSAQTEQPKRMTFDQVYELVKGRRLSQLSFAFDHRVCDGGTAAGFLRTVADAMENPAAAIVGL